MDNRNNLTYEQMFMDDYNKFIYPELSSEKYGNLQEPGSTVVGVVGDVAREAGGMIAESAKEYGKYVKETPLSQSIPATLNELGKGVVSGAIGIGGDTEQLLRGIYQVITKPENQSKLEAFFKGLEQDPLFPTSAEIEKVIEQIIGESPKGTGFVEGTGNVLAPATAITKGAKVTGKALQKMKAK
jgi:hypothetical protein